jgi:hypothetical protein
MTKSCRLFTERNMKRLQGLVDIANPVCENNLENFERLEEELYRANIVEPENSPLDVVTINSKVQLREELREQKLKRCFVSLKFQGNFVSSLYA